MTDFNDIQEYIVITNTLIVRSHPFFTYPQFTSLNVDTIVDRIPSGGLVKVLKHIRLVDERSGFVWRRLATPDERWAVESNMFTRTELLVEKD